MQGDTKLYKVEAAAEVLTISRAKLWQLIRRGSIRVTRIDGCVRISAAAIEAFIEECTEGSNDERAR